MREVIVLIPAAGDYGDVWEGRFARYEAALAAVGVAARAVRWNEYRAVPGDVVLPLLAWGYHRHGAAWPLALAEWSAAGARLVNAAALIAWNMRKTYLDALAAAGVPIVPTLHVAAVDAATAATARARFGVDRLVMKPQVSAGSDGTTLVEAGEAGPVGARVMMVQPFLPAIATAGEVSLLHFGGTLSHAVRKVPRAGDFRVQEQFGSVYAAIDPDPAMLAVAATALAALPAAPAYARIDLVRGDAGWLVIEIELIEPDLYLDLADGAGERFARAIAAAIG